MAVEPPLDVSSEVVRINESAAFRGEVEAGGVVNLARMAIDGQVELGAQIDERYKLELPIIYRETPIATRLTIHGQVRRGHWRESRSANPEERLPHTLKKTVFDGIFEIDRFHDGGLFVVHSIIQATTVDGAEASSTPTGNTVSVFGELFLKEQPKYTPNIVLNADPSDISATGYSFKAF